MQLARRKRQNSGFVSVAIMDEIQRAAVVCRSAGAQIGKPSMPLLARRAPTKGRAYSCVLGLWEDKQSSICGSNDEFLQKRDRSGGERMFDIERREWLPVGQ